MIVIRFVPLLKPVQSHLSQYPKKITTPAARSAMIMVTTQRLLMYRHHERSLASIVAKMSNIAAITTPMVKVSIRCFRMYSHHELFITHERSLAVIVSPLAKPHRVRGNHHPPLVFSETIPGAGQIGCLVQMTFICGLNEPKGNSF